MSRTRRVVFPGIPYHLVQRGNNTQDVFRDDGDRETYLDILRAQSRKYDLKIFAYCLMTNHVHLVAVPGNESALSKGIGRTHFTYTQVWNRKYGASGHLWQNRFYSSLLDEEYFWRALLYVERNPVNSGMVAFAWEYPWSSARAHVDGADEYGLLDMAQWRQSSGNINWRSSLMKETDAVFRAALSRSMKSDKPLASHEFLLALEFSNGIQISPARRGRPRGK